MTTNTTMIVDCGPLGEQEWTIQYKVFKADGRKHVIVNWIKLGGERGYDISDEVADDYIADEVWPHCLQDHEDGIAYAAECKADRMREERRLACG